MPYANFPQCVLHVVIAYILYVSCFLYPREDRLRLASSFGVPINLLQPHGRITRSPHKELVSADTSTYVYRSVQSTDLCFKYILQIYPI